MSPKNIKIQQPTSLTKSTRRIAPASSTRIVTKKYVYPITRQLKELLETISKPPSVLPSFNWTLE